MQGTKEVIFATREERSQLDGVKKGSTYLHGKKGRVKKKNNLFLIIQLMSTITFFSLFNYCYFSFSEQLS